MQLAFDLISLCGDGFQARQIHFTYGASEG